FVCKNHTKTRAPVMMIIQRRICRALELKIKSLRLYLPLVAISQRQTKGQSSLDESGLLARCSLKKAEQQRQPLILGARQRFFNLIQRGKPASLRSFRQRLCREVPRGGRFSCS